MIPAVTEQDGRDGGDGSRDDDAAPVRFGLVGYGFGGRYFHAPLLAAAPECELVAVVTASADRRDQVAREHPGVPAVGSLEELAAAGAEAVAISTPADTHTALTDRALDLGLAVVCDKPFALDAPAARASVQLAERRGLVLAPYQNRRWDSDFRTVQALVADGVLGEVTRFESRFERLAPDAGPGVSGGGTLRDFGSHLVDQALVLLGPVGSVYAEWRLRANGLDDDVFVALTHTNGARSHLWGSWGQSAPGPRLRVTGSAASYVVGTDGGIDGQEDALVAGQTPVTLGDRWGAEPPERWGRVYRGDGGEPVRTLPGAWDTFYPAFAAAVRGRGPVPVDPRDAVATAMVLDAARRSATERVLVDLAS
jgi:predicted dehydrogenase